MIKTPDAARPEGQHQRYQRRSPSRLREEPLMSTTSTSTAWIRAGLVALPLYGLILGFTTRKPQADQVDDPDGWAAIPQHSVVLGGAHREQRPGSCSGDLRSPRAGGPSYRAARRQGWPSGDSSLRLPV